jgi:hypothetical protein
MTSNMTFSSTLSVRNITLKRFVISGVRIGITVVPGTAMDEFRILKIIFFRYNIGKRVNLVDYTGTYQLIYCNL